MKIGPFSINEAENIKSLLEVSQINFDAYIDKDLEQTKISEFNQMASQFPRQMAGKLDLQTVFFEIKDEDFKKVSPQLEKYGISSTNSDGSFELGED